MIENSAITTVTTAQKKGIDSKSYRQFLWITLCATWWQCWQTGMTTRIFVCCGKMQPFHKILNINNLHNTNEESKS